MSPSPTPAGAAAAREIEELRQRLHEAEELIEAIRTGAVDALAVQGAEGPRIFTLEGADQGYRTLIEQMNEGAMLLSDDATVLYCNACLASLLEVPLEDVIGLAFEQFVPAEFAAYWTALLAKGWAGKSKGEMPLRTRQGKLTPFSLSMNVLEFHESPVLAVILTDLSAQREIKVIKARVEAQNALIEHKNEELRAQQTARREMEQAAAEAQRLLEGIPQIAWTANPAGRNTYLNRRWFDFIGPENAIGADGGWSAQLHPADAPAAAERWKECLQTGDFFEVEYRFKNQAGEYRWMLGRALPSRNEHGEIIQWIGTCTDIHEHKMTQERIALTQRQLQDNNAQLTRANVDLDNFIYTASHDLRAPITNIEGLLHALISELPPVHTFSADVAPILHMMQDSVDRFQKTISQLTDISKLQKEDGQPLEPIELEAIIRDVLLDLKPLVQQTGGTIEVDISECPSIAFSEKNLRSVVFNLLSNALKYRHPSRPPQVQLRAYCEGAFAVLAVADNGLGLDASGQTKLFGMFQRLHDHVEGSGIGLYMVKKMVENAGGHITVQSEIGTGTVFAVYFVKE
ncbi:ATP-binding protein [Hymenobacter sp. ASUV-10]|uniref:histidine kinase n=1 Tax=Hymenobacter aranciens TaxID=3063996 RepID=A0ABT9BM71_9BACT|nr:ATP-binding protein [Hymenobacter sp. ASUV-10]MDO7877633.1 ATP-binding protein [Hymenobacter sp. ASUV-10]